MDDDHLTPEDAAARSVDGKLTLVARHLVGLGVDPEAITVTCDPDDPMLVHISWPGGPEVDGMPDESSEAA